MSIETITERQKSAISKASELTKSLIKKYNMSDDDIQVISDTTCEMYNLGLNDALEELENKLLKNKP